MLYMVNTMIHNFVFVEGVIPLDSQQSGCADKVVLQEFDVGKLEE